LYPQDDRLAQWAKNVHQIYAEAKGLASPQARQRQGYQLRIAGKLLALCRPFLDDPLAVHAKLCRRIERFIKELFVFVSHPEVPTDNPDDVGAERSLRHLVTARKISGGTRSGSGTTSKLILASLFGTWRTRGLNPFLQCRQLLISPQV
jgi:hypothetical protein